MCRDFAGKNSLGFESNPWCECSVFCHCCFYQEAIASLFARLDPDTAASIAVECRVKAAEKTVHTLTLPNA